MAVVKKNFRVSRLEREVSPKSRDCSMSSDEEDELQQKSSASECNEEFDNEDDDDDYIDSGMESDDVDVSELGEVGEEMCQVGNQICSVPIELYDLPDLSEILSVDVWNNLLTEEDRFRLAEYLPDMEELNFMRTLKELFSGGNLHFGSPVKTLFNMLKGGLCEPRVALYRQGFDFFQKRRHYHLLQKYQNYMVVNLHQISDAWANCKGYSIQEKLRVLNLMRSQKNLMHEKMEDIGMETDSSGREGLGEDFWLKRSKEATRGLKMDRQAVNKVSPVIDVSSRGRAVIPEFMKYGKQNPKGILKLAESRSGHHGLQMKARPYTSMSNSLREPGLGYDLGTTERGSMAKGGVLGAGRKHVLKSDALHSQAKGRNVNQMAMMTERHDSGPPNCYSGDSRKKVKYPDKIQHSTVEGTIKGRGQHLLMNRNRGEDHPSNFEDWDIRSKKWKMQPEIQNTRNIRADMEEISMSDETESDSSDQVDSEEDTKIRRNRWGYPSGDLEGPHRKLVPDSKQLARRNLDGIKYSSKKVSHDLGRRSQLSDVEVYSLKGKQKGKMHDPRYLHNDTTEISEENGYYGLAKVNDDNRKKAKKIVKNGRIHGGPGERMYSTMLKAYPAERKQKGKVDQGYPYLHNNTGDVDDRVRIDRLGKRTPPPDAYVTDNFERSDLPLMGCSQLTKKRKRTDMAYANEPDDYDNQHYKPLQQVDDPSFLKKRGKRKVEAESGSLPTTVSSFIGLADVDPEAKPAKKSFTLITPTVHTGFSFSIIHLLTAIRLAMTTPLAENVSDIGKLPEKSVMGQNPKKEMQNVKHETVNGEVHSYRNTDTIMSDGTEHKNLPSLTVQEIINCVRLNPGDPCILETQEPLQDLVRGVLKIFSSKSAPLGAKGWKALVLYEKSTKSWSWIGPLSSSTSDPNSIEEVTSSEGWGLPHKMLVKLVDSFANWLKNSQETLQQIGSLPAPPLSLMQPNLDEKERFRDLRAQKSLSTISASSEEVRAYFQREEVLRYLVPDRAFSYTASDGRKSIVAPLRRCGGKLTAKARDHPILKPDRPPHVTILCLVRDAAARLPGSIGTRADVCTLIRDSQYIVEDVTDIQVNQVVSGALDRLHYERDPCVQFDGERKLWVYLHRDREEEDFEDDGTSSTKKWKRPRKDAAEQSETGAVSVAYHGSGEQIIGGSDVAYGLNTNLNIEPSSMRAGERTEFLYNNLRLNGDEHSAHFVGSRQGSLHQGHPMEEQSAPFVGSRQGSLHQGHPMGWEILGLNSPHENKMLCQENSTNESYDDESFNRDRPVGLISASIS